jgi:guanylate kinase
VIDRRLRDAVSDMSHWEEFDYVVINDDLEEAVTELEAVLGGRGELNATGNTALASEVESVIG